MILNFIISCIYMHIRQNNYNKTISSTFYSIFRPILVPVLVPVLDKNLL